MDENSCWIDDFGPLQVVQPRTSAEIGDLVRSARSEEQALYPLGGQTMLRIGLPPTRPGLAIDLRAFAEIIDYPARDMTITVQSGITMSRLQALLATEHQRLPIDVPQADRATLGGVLATNASGPRRLGHGTLRDYVIGISTINDEGQEVKAGGRVVKNVAGYDLCKLHIGALGTLGIITQVTLKLRPLPESKALVTFGCDSQTLDNLLDRLHATRTRPVCLDLLNQSIVRALVGMTSLSLPEAPWVIVAGFEDNNEAVGWQVRQLLQEITSAEIHGLEARAGVVCEPLWQALTEAVAQPSARLSFKANLMPDAVAAFCRHAGSLHESMRLHAHAGSGIVHGHLEGDLTLPRAHAMLEELTTLAVRAEGNLVVLNCPVEWKRELPIWGRQRNDLWLMREVKNKLDPRRLFNPGRYLDGI